MDIRHIDESYHVSPQITPEDAAALAEAGFSTLICNRPDAEVPPALQAEAMRQAEFRRVLFRSSCRSPIRP